MLNFTPQENHILQSFHREILDNLSVTKRFLKDNPNIFFTKSDKGNVTVCLNTNEYQEKMENLLNDKNTYQSVSKNPLKSLQSKSLQDP